MSETVDHPAHYNAHPSGVECITIVEHFDFLIGNVIKYAWRAGLKPGTERLEDLKKMLWYAQRAVQKEQQLAQAAPPDGRNGHSVARPESGTVFDMAYGDEATILLPPTQQRPMPASEPTKPAAVSLLPIGFDDSFIYLCGRLIEVIYQNSRAKGFWDKERNDGETLALIHSELSEALEALRQGNPPDDKVPDFSSLEAELADVIIRIFDYAGGRGLNIAQAICAKVRFNQTRGRMHGKQF